jgi:hypothetical protein
LSFTVDATDGLVNSTSFTPDEFSFSILEKTGAQVPTTAPNGSSLLTETFNSPQITIQTYSPILPASVPLPSPGALVLLSLPLIAWASRRLAIRS